MTVPASRSRFQVGDEILFATYGGAEFTLDDEEFLTLAEKAILAVVTS